MRSGYQVMEFLDKSPPLIQSHKRDGEMEVDDILKKYGLTNKTATQYIDAITCMNQTQAAEEIGVSRETIHRYKKAFDKMNPVERSQLIATLTQNKFLERATEE